MCLLALVLLLSKTFTNSQKDSLSHFNYNFTSSEYKYNNSGLFSV